MILIGDSTVGKSSLLRFFTDGKFSEISDQPSGVDFYARLIQVGMGRGSNSSSGILQAGKISVACTFKNFSSITKSYYRNSVGAIVAYDITSRESFERIPNWISEAKRLIEPFSPTFLIVACKSDLESQRVVPVEEGFSYANAMGIHFVETSARSGNNVEEAFQQIAQEIYNRIQSGEYKIDDEGFDGIKQAYSRNGNILCCLKALQKNQSAADGHGFIRAAIVFNVRFCDK
ncbi:Ras-related protein Rab-39B [Orchesella cincta]|uniref:Ras-related protein Rab-39B n=1 Tax=Orchesella cincta TaxID=48709 RepID=A0A1D2MFE7_ORCCI|nr:Ras-related protein Rab-39B [Orchesella cincta]